MYYKIKHKHKNDLIIYLQKKYKLYFVEYRVAPNGKNAVCLCNPNNKNWWVQLLDGFYTYNDIDVFFAGHGNVSAEEIEDIFIRKKYKGFAKKAMEKNKWLKL